MTLRCVVSALLLAAAALPSSAEPCPGAAPALPDGEHAIEYWDLTARLEPGFALFQRFLITNLGPGERTAGAVGVVVRPDGSIDHYDNGRRAGRWTLGDGPRLEVGSSALELRAPEVRLAIRKKSARIELRVRCDADAAARPPPAFAATGHDLRLLAVSAPVAGTLWLRGMSEPLSVTGRAALSHTVALDEATQIAERLEFHSLGTDLAWSLYAVTPRSARSPADAASGRWIVFTQGGRTLLASAQVDLVREGLAPGWNRSGYPVPGRLRARIGSAASAELRFGPVLFAQDPLEVLPQPFRFWVGRRMDPLRVWARPEFDVTIPPGLPGGSEPKAAGAPSPARPEPVASQPAPVTAAPGASVLARALAEGIEGRGLAALSFTHPVGPPPPAQ
jgi:hypothetical protein